VSCGRAVAKRHTPRARPRGVITISSTTASFSPEDLQAAPFLRLALACLSLTAGHMRGDLEPERAAPQKVTRRVRMKRWCKTGWRRVRNLHPVPAQIATSRPQDGSFEPRKGPGPDLEFGRERGAGTWTERTFRPAMPCPTAGESPTPDPTRSARSGRPSDSRVRAVHGLSRPCLARTRRTRKAAALAPQWAARWNATRSGPGFWISRPPRTIWVFRLGPSGISKLERS